MNDFQNIKRLLLPAIKGIPIIIAAIIFSLIIASRAIIYKVPIYESTAKLKLDDKSTGVSNSNLFKDFDLFTSNKKILTEVEVIKSSELIKETLTKLDFNISYYRIGRIKKKELYHETPFRVSAEISDNELYNQEIQVWILDNQQFKFKIKTTDQIITNTAFFDEQIALAGITFTISLNTEFIKEKKNFMLIDSYSFILHSEQALIELVKANIDVSEMDKEMAIIRISYKSEVPEKTAILANKIAHTYINDYISNKAEAAKRTVKFIDDQLLLVAKNLSSSEFNLKEFKVQNKVVNTYQETETGLREISQIRIQLNNLLINEAAIDSLDFYINRSGNNFTELAPQVTFGDLLFTELIKKMKQYQSEKEDLLLKYTIQNDQVKMMDRKINDLIKYIKESIHNAKKDLNIKKVNLQKLLSKSERIFDSLPEREREQLILERNFQLNQQIYHFLMEKRTEAAIAAAATIAFHRIIGYASIPRIPIVPKVRFILIVSAFLGIVFSLILIYSRDFIKGQIRNRFDFEKVSSTPVLAIIPNFTKKQIANNESNEELDRITKNLIVSSIIKQREVLVITSTVQYEGKTFVSAKLAESLARHKWRVVLIDGNSLAPGHKYLASKQEPNSSSKLEYETTLANLWFMPNSRFKSINSLHPEKDEFNEHLIRLKTQFDIIIIDTPAIALESDAIRAMKLADKNCFIIRANFTKRQYQLQSDILREEYGIDQIFCLVNSTHKATNYNGLYTGSSYQYKNNKLNFLKKLNHYIKFYL